MIFTPQQVQVLMDIINRHMLTFIAKNVGPDLLTNDEKSLLLMHGVDVTKIMITETAIYKSFAFGILSQALGHTKVVGMDYNKFKSFLQSNEWVPLNARENFVLDSIKRQSFKDIKNLGAKIQLDCMQAMSKTATGRRKDYEKIISDAALKTVEDRKSAKDMVSEIGHKTGQWGRDFDRISDYILHKGYDEGKVAQIQSQYGDNALIYKDVYAGACKHCIRLYLTGGIGSEPIIFKASELIANGDNIGRKTSQWKPVIGSTHPYCRCTSNHLPDGYKWNPETKSFQLSSDFVRKVKRKLS